MKIDPRGFLTGSRVYGEPRPDSDFDVVISVDEDTYEKLFAKFGDPGSWDFMRYGGDIDDVDSWAPLKIGQLHLICCCSPKVFAMWRQGTEELFELSIKLGRPMTRDEAVEHFSRLRFESKGQ